MDEPVSDRYASETSIYASETSLDPSLSAAYNKITWGAVFAGVVLALAVQVLLNLLGVGIGAAVLDPMRGDNPAASTFSIVGGLWFALSGIIAAFIGGYIASRLSGRPSTSTGGYHGIAMWALATLVVLYLLTTSIGTLVGGAFSGLTSIVSGVGQTMANVAPSITGSLDPMTRIEQQIRGTGGDAEALRTAAVAAVQSALTADPATAEAARTRAAEALARAQNIPVDQARTQIDQYAQDYRATLDAAQRQAADAAQAAKTVVSSGAILGFIALLFGGMAAWFGGVAGTKGSFRVSVV